MGCAMRVPTGCPMSPGGVKCARRRAQSDGLRRPSFRGYLRPGVARRVSVLASRESAIGLKTERLKACCEPILFGSSDVSPVDAEHSRNFRKRDFRHTLQFRGEHLLPNVSAHTALLGCGHDFQQVFWHMPCLPPLEAVDRFCPQHIAVPSDRVEINGASPHWPEPAVACLVPKVCVLVRGPDEHAAPIINCFVAIIGAPEAVCLACDKRLDILIFTQTGAGFFTEK